MLKLISGPLGDAQQSIALNSEPAIGQALVEFRTKFTLSSNQLRHCASKSAEDNTIIDTAALGVATHQFPAERLVEYLRKESDLNFILLIHENTATKLLTNTRIGKVRGTNEQSAYCPNITDANTLSCAESVRKLLGLSGNTKLLLGAALVFVQQQRMFFIFPETLCADVTMGTNAEKRP